MSAGGGTEALGPGRSAVVIEWPPVSGTPHDSGSGLALPGTRKSADEVPEMMGVQRIGTLRRAAGHLLPLEIATPLFATDQFEREELVLAQNLVHVTRF